MQIDGSKKKSTNTLKALITKAFVRLSGIYSDRLIRRLLSDTEFRKNITKQLIGMYLTCYVSKVI